MLEKINSPEDVKKLKIEEKKQLAQEIREYILQVVKWRALSIKPRSGRINTGVK